MLRYVLKGLFIFLILIAIIGGRLLYLQRSHYLKAERYYSEGNLKLAITEYDTSMHFYLPFSPYTEKSAQRLWSIGEMFEKEDKTEWAHMAYSSIRSSLYGVRSLFTPKKRWINRCDEKLADLNIRILLKEGSIKPDDATKEREKYIYTLKVDRAPKPLWSVLMAIGFIGWVTSIVFIIFKGFDKNSSGRLKPLLYGALSFIFFLSIWLIALLRA